MNDEIPMKAEEHNIVNPYWSILDPELIDDSTTQYDYVNYKEQNVATSATQTSYTLETKDIATYLYPHAGKLQFSYKIVDTTGNPIPITDKVAVQNNILSLFKDITYYIEDQSIEKLDMPGLAYTIKNVSEFSKQYGQSVSSNENFFLDTFDRPIIPKCNLRFFNTSNANFELYFVMNATPNMATTVPTTVVGGTVTWTANDVIVPRIEITPGVFKDVTFYSDAAYNTAIPPGTGATGVARSLTVQAGGLLSLNNVAADDHYIRGFIDDGTEIIFMGNDSRIFLQQHGGAASPIDAVTPGIFGTASAAVAAGVFITGYANVKNAYNKGFYERQKRVQSTGTLVAPVSKVDSVWIPLANMFSFCRHYRKVVRGQRHKITINKNNVADALLKFGNQPDRNFIITDISLWIPAVAPNLKIINPLETSLASRQITNVYFTDLYCWKSGTSFNQGNSKSVEVAVSSKKIIKVWIAFQNAARVNSIDQSYNKRVFDDITVTNIQVRLNNNPFPNYQHNFNSTISNYDGWNRAYVNLMDAGYKLNDTDEGSLLNLDQFKTLYPIFYFDLQAQPDELFMKTATQKLQIYWDCGAANNINYYPIVMYESERMIKIQALEGTIALII